MNDLKTIANALDNGSNLKKEQKQKLVSFLKKALNKDGQTLEEATAVLVDEIKAALTEEVKAELKTEAKNELKADQATIMAAIDALKAEEATKTAAIDELKADQATITAAIDTLLTEELKGGIKGLIKLTGQELEDKVKSLYDEKLKNTIEGIIDNNLSEMKDEDKEELHKGLQSKIKSIIETDQSKNVDEIVKLIKPKLTDDIINAGKFNKKVADLKEQLKVREQDKQNLEAELTQVKDAKEQAEKKVKDLGTQLSNLPNADQLKAKEDELNKLSTQVQQLQTAQTKNLKEYLAQKAQIFQLEGKNKELENKSKTIQQPKQGNGARYTATVGMGLAAGLIAFTALERTVRLDIWVMVGIAVVSTLELVVLHMQHYLVLK
ncbi:MAG: hypothetical protein ACEY3M_22295 [Wolbachia sp.]